MTRISALLLCSLFFLSNLSYADDFYFSELTEVNGQSIGSVRTLFADKQGFLWFAGDSGTFRFDGYELLEVNNMPTRGVFMDNNGHFWSAGTTTLSALLPGTFENRFYPHLSNKRKKPEQEIIYDMLQMADGRQFFATDEGLSEYHVLQDDFSHFTLFHNGKSLAATALFQSSAGRIYLGTNEGLFALETTKLTERTRLDKPLISGMKVIEMAELSNGELLVGSNGGLYHLDTSNQVKDHFVFSEHDESSISHDNVTALLVDNQNNIWVGTSKGLNILDLGKGQFKRFFHRSDNQHGISNNLITDIYQDNQQNVLIANYVGINRYNPSDIYLQPSQPSDFGGQSINNVWNLFEDTDGTRWVGTFGSGLFRDSSDALGGTHISNFTANVSDDFSLLNNRISALNRDENGKLWIGTTKGLQYFDATQKGQFETVHAIDTSVFDIEFGSDGSLWLAGSNGAYRVSEDLTKVEHFGKDSFMQVVYKQWVRSVLPVDDLVLVGSDKGLSVLDFGRQTSTSHESLGSVLEILKDSENNLWVLAMPGLALFDPQERSLRKIESLQVKEGDANGCNGMVEDNQKQLWLVCNNSLKVVDVRTRQLIQTYSAEQGVDLTGFLTGSSSIVMANDGKVLVAERKGIREFIPPKLNATATSSKVVLTKAQFGNAEGLIDNPENPFHFANPLKQKLPYDLQKVEFEFTGLDNARPKAVTYRYRLMGYEQNHNSTSFENRRAVYTNLPGGDYQFEVLATYPDGSVSKADYPFSINVAPWLTWWAITFYVLVVLSLGYLIIIMRTRALSNRGMELEQQVAERTEQLLGSKQQIEKLMNEREKLIENIHHQTRTPLQIMLGNIDGLLDGSLTQSEYAKKQTDNVHSLVQLTDRILNVTKSPESPEQSNALVDLTGLMNNLCVGFSDVAKAKKLSFDFAVDNHLQTMGSVESLTDVIENVINNSIKYTDVGGIHVSLSQKADRIVFQCADTGIGIPADAQESIFERYQRAENATDRDGSGIGLAMVKEVVYAHSGMIELHSELGQGTSIAITLPKVEKTTEKSVSELNDVMSWPESEAVEEDTAKATLLLVEDNLELVSFMNKLLASKYNLLSAINGQDGLEQARRHVPDLILSDVMMPLMDGFELTEQLRKDEVTCHIPLMLITAKNDQLSREKGFALGANDFINKPFKAAELLNRVTNQLALIEAVKVKAAKEQQVTALPESMHDRLIARYLSFIEDNYQDSELQIKSVCDALHVSNRQLERKVKHFLNMTPNALLNEYRLSRARELIEQGKKPNQVYHLCGFGSHAYFSKRFKQKYGKLPSQFNNDTQDA